MHYKTVVLLENTAGQEFKDMARLPGWHVVSTEFMLWSARQRLKAFVGGWFGIVVQN